MKVHAARLAGASRTGSDRAGTVFHALPVGTYKAVCGKTYGKRSAGWSEYYGRAVTCPACLRKLAKMGEAVDVIPE